MPTQTLEHRGCRLSYVLEGQGPPVLWVQGTGVGARGWRPQIDPLSSRWSCLSWDNRGFGASQPLGTDITVPQLAEDALRLMDAVGWSSAHVVGHSLGGLISLELARVARERVRSLSLLCTFATGKVPLRPAWSVIWPGIRSKLGSMASRRRAFMELILTPNELPQAETLAPLLSDLFEHDLATTPPVVMKQMRAMGACDQRGSLAALAGLPTLVVSAEHDRLAPPWAGRELAEGVPGARFVELNDAAHAVVVTQADRVNGVLEAFFSGGVEALGQG